MTSSAQIRRPREIAHLNVANFAAAVERLAERRLTGRPFIVGIPGAPRARVMDMSEEAYQAGIRKLMPLDRAKRVCREAHLVPPKPELYRRAMSALVKLSGRYSPLVEAGEADGHLFLDLTGTRRLFGPAKDTAWRLRREVRNELKLDPVWSVAGNKLVAKAASRVVKPDGEMVIPPGQEESFLRPLPINRLPGLVRDDLRLMRELNIGLVGQLADWSRDQLEALWGKRGLDLFRWVRGIDEAPVLPPAAKPPRVSAEHEFTPDTNDRFEVEASLLGLVEMAGLELRGRGLAVRRLAVRLDYSDGVRIIRQRTDRIGTTLDAGIFSLACSALNLAWQRRVRIRRMGLIGDRLIPPPTQLELFPEENEEAKKAGRIQAALDDIRRRFGVGAVRFGRTMVG